jgi:hypothetical protein
MIIPRGSCGIRDGNDSGDGKKRRRRKRVNLFLKLLLSYTEGGKSSHAAAYAFDTVPAVERMVDRGFRNPLTGMPTGVITGSMNSF